MASVSLRTRPVGVTVDYCPVCRRERRFRFAEARQHQYFMMLDRGPVGTPHHELTCTTCGAILERDVEERPLTRTVSTAGEVHEPEVLPLVRQRIADWTDMERRRVDGGLRDEERMEMIRTAMLSFSRLYDEQVMARVHPVTTTALMIISLALAGGGVWAWMEVRQPWVLIAVLATIVVFIAGMLVWIRSRCPKSKARRWVAASLAPLDPTEAEITKIKREMLTSRLKSGECIKPTKIRKAIEKYRARVGVVLPA